MSQHRANSNGVTRMLAGVIAAGALSIPLAGVASASPPPKEPHGGDVSVSVNGIPRKISTNPATIATTTETTSRGGANVAIARDNSTARAAFGTGNKARATNDSDAFANNGDNNTATASDNSTAIAQSGNNNTATATNDSLAIARNGDNNTATATDGIVGQFSVAIADGNNNTATATCSGFAVASGSNQTATNDGGAC